jgi:hypothetical protein
VTSIFFLPSGADVVIVESIRVRIFPRNQPSLSNFSRRPIARACVPMLELEDSYESMPELAEEFNQILSADIWLMDII